MNKQYYRHRGLQQAIAFLALAVCISICLTPAQSQKMNSSREKADLHSFGPPPDGSMPDGPPPGEEDSDSAVFSGVYSQSDEKCLIAGKRIHADKEDLSGIYLSAASSLEAEKLSITKKGDTTLGGTSNFRGLNAGVLVAEGSRLVMKKSTVETDGEGANAVFSTGKGSEAVLSDTVIVTRRNSSRGVDATMGGKITGVNLDIETAGEHCAAIATDRGEGTIIIKGGKMRTAGPGSPCIYSTGDISVMQSDLAAYGSEAAVIEGKNSITLSCVTISGSKLCGVMLYQSFSGDADSGTSVLTIDGGSLTSGEGPLFYITNTNAKIFLKKAILKSTSGQLLTSSIGRWGRKGSNGGHVAVTAESQTLEGDITCDGISTIEIALTSGSVLRGKIAASSLSVDATSCWTVQGDSSLKAFIRTGNDSAESAASRITGNGYTISYDASLPQNGWLEGKIFSLKNGGELKPAQL